MDLFRRARKIRLRWGILLAVVLLCAVQVWRWGRPVELAFAVEQQAGEWRIERAGTDEVWRAEDTDGDGTLDRFTGPGGMWLRPGGEQPPARWLIVCLDGAPYRVLDELWQRGRFREFHRPSALVSAFPSDSETAITAALHAPPVDGYEHQYFDRAENRIRGGVWKTLTGRRVPYLARLDYVAPGWHKSIQYVVVRKSWHAEMGRLRQLFRAANREGTPLFHAHVSSGDPIFHMLTDAELAPLLREFEAVVREAYLEAGGELGVVLWSDHGNSRALSRGVPLDELLQTRGWRRRESLEAPRDVAIPAYGLVGFFAVYCNEDAVEELAQDLVTRDGADLIVYRTAERDGAVILGADGSRAMLRWSADGSRYRYEAARGDPLGLAPVFDALRAAGKLTEGGWAADADLFAATARAWYPDAAARIHEWATNHVRNPSDLVVSLKPGWYQGKGTFDRLVTMRGTHGALERTSSLGFAMSTTLRFPATLRLADLLPPELLKPPMNTDKHR